MSETEMQTESAATGPEAGPAPVPYPGLEAPPEKPKIPALAERPAHMPTPDEVKTLLRDIYDPELFISIVELGLVYGAEYLPGDVVRVLMTLTSPACPLGETLLAQVKTRLTTANPAIKDAEVEWVWVPRWDPREMASEEAKMLLGIF